MKLKVKQLVVHFQGKCIEIHIGYDKETGLLAGDDLSLEAVGQHGGFGLVALELRQLTMELWIKGAAGTGSVDQQAVERHWQQQAKSNVKYGVSP